MNKSHFTKVLAMLGIAFAASNAFAKGTSRAVGSGIVYPAPSHALIQNASALPEAPRASVEGIYFFQDVDSNDKFDGHASLVGSTGMVGLGVGWRQQLTVNTYEAGFGAWLGKRVGLGATVRSTDIGENLDGDLALSIDFSKLRLAVVARSIDDEINRMDVGLGMTHGPVTVEFNAKKTDPFDFDVKNYLFDAGLAAHHDMFSFGIGYDFSYNGTDWVDGGLHAGVGLGLMQNRLIIEGFYRPMVQEGFSNADWNAGIKYNF